MIDTTPKFDPIPRLQQIAATIEESGADAFDAPATAAYYIECAIKEIERLREERDEAMRFYCEMLDGYDGITCKEWAKRYGWDCFKET